MAKGSAMGLWKGKKGNTVFFKITNSNNKEKQGEREYQPNVRNPQSNGQAGQRAKLLPAQQIKLALYDVLSRSFEGIQYGAKSRLEFIRLAVREKSGYPYLEKGFYKAVPGKYQVSKGSLGVLTCQEVFVGDEAFIYNTSIQLSERFDPATTIGNLSADIISTNPQFEFGDQLTIIGCLLANGENLIDGNYRWFYWSFYLDTTDETPLRDISGMDFVALASPSSQESTNPILRVIAGNPSENRLVGAAVIHSREGNEGQHLRSSSRIAIAKLLDGWFSAGQDVISRASYQTNTRASSSDWPVQDSDTRGGGSSDVIDALYTLSGLTGAMASLNGRQVRTRYNGSLGEYVAVYVRVIMDDFVCVDANNGGLMYNVRDPETGVLDVHYLRPADVVDLADLRQILVSF